MGANPFVLSLSPPLRHAMPRWFHSVKSSGSPAGEDQQDSAAESARQFREGLSDHLRARAELLALEASEAGELITRKGILGLAAISLLLFGYALVLGAGISLLGRWTAKETGEAIGWELPAFLIGIIHLIASVPLLRKLKRKPEEALFKYTRAEFKKDHAWLDQDKNAIDENECSS